MFRVGQKVVCVDASRLRARAPLKKGAVYTVRWAGQRPTDHEPGIMVEEFSCWHSRHHLEWSFRATRFRPVVDRPTDISIFTRMLTDADEKVEVSA